ncbi:6-phosphofructokinase [Desulfonatronum thiosulfatophilum]|uniref:6-phosphofructokinase n=1 Tax=Desulfonatronum thiosulfatophilum TaxID=617002 RepID=A0A1G6CJU1_9BACT|nr:1-phosphofructokinase family hexose kinase [Desulfonatronum thiosulfatophilum]SDB33126.1 6-phosphofructokinase [Desulfonatronum thiosulfatophilum]
MSGIVTLTMNPTIDKSTSINNVVAERKLRCDRPRYEPGGGGVNVSRAVKKLGEDSLAVYLAGGPPGDMLKRLLDAEEIRQDPYQIKGLTRENLVVFETSTQQQYRFGMPGPEIQVHEWQGCLDRLEQMDPTPGFLVCSGSLPPGVPPDFYARIAGFAKKTGSKVILDTSGDPLTIASETGVFLMKPNHPELESLAGKALENEQEQEELLQDLVEAGRAEVIVASLGAAGALLVWKEGVFRTRAPNVPIKSKVGAGDSMVAGMVTALFRGWNMPDAVRFGVAAGAAAVMTPGSELCRREDTERLYKKIKDE